MGTAGVVKQIVGIGSWICVGIGLWWLADGYLKPDDSNPDSDKDLKTDGNDQKIIYDADGYDQFGFDVEGYSRDGFNRQGIDHDGYDKAGYKNGFDRSGHNKNGYLRTGYNDDGLDISGNATPYYCNEIKRMNKQIDEAYAQMQLGKFNYE